MKESTLTRLKAERMSPSQLRSEIERIDTALNAQTTKPREIKRYQARREIFEAELKGRLG